MSPQFGNTKIGAMQYNSVTIGEAMMDGVVVYRSAIRVTPAAPIFHDGDPWVTLPTVEGVIYSVAGTPGYNVSVTITATAQTGYELVGTTSWTHTYGPPPLYVASGTVPSTLLPRSTPTVIASHTISRPVTVTVTGTVVWNQVPTNTSAARFSILLNGNRVSTGNPPVSGFDVVHSYTVVLSCQTGDIVAFEVNNTTSSELTRRINSGSWSITE